MSRNLEWHSHLFGRDGSDLSVRAAMEAKELVPFALADEDGNGLLYRNGLMLVASKPGVGKSALATTAALQYAREGKHSLLLDLEMSEGEDFSRWLQAGGSKEEYVEYRHYLSSASSLFPRNLNELVSLLTLAVTEWGIEHVQIDSLSPLLAWAGVSNENSASEVMPTLNALRIPTQVGPPCSVLLLAHSTKSSEQIGTKGSIAFDAACDLHLSLAKGSLEGSDFDIDVTIVKDRFGVVGHYGNKVSTIRFTRGANRWLEDEQLWLKNTFSHTVSFAEKVQPFQRQVSYPLMRWVVDECDDGGLAPKDYRARVGRPWKLSDGQSVSDEQMTQVLGTLKDAGVITYTAGVGGKGGAPEAYTLTEFIADSELRALSSEHDERFSGRLVPVNQDDDPFG